MGTFIVLQVNNNGVISFVKELSTYKPEEFPLKDDTAIISPFWADVDVENVGGSVWYRQSSNPAVLRRVTSEINQYFPRGAKFQATWIFIATWDNVGFYGADVVGKDKVSIYNA